MSIYRVISQNISVIIKKSTKLFQQEQFLLITSSQRNLLASCHYNRKSIMLQSERDLQVVTYLYVMVAAILYCRLRLVSQGSISDLEAGFCT